MGIGREGDRNRREMGWELGENGTGRRDGVGTEREGQVTKTEEGGNYVKRDRIHTRRQEPWEKGQNQREAGRNGVERG